MMQIRKETRVIGIDDGPFHKFRNGKVIIIGTIFRGSKSMDGMLSTQAQVDGTDSTQKIADMINKSRFKTQLRCIFLNGITIGGFNVIDLSKLFKLTSIPIIAVTRKNPDIRKICQTLTELKMTRKIKLIQQLPQPQKIGKVYIQHIGLTMERAKEYLNLTTVNAEVPEPLRIAHIIAAGIIKGESKGRA